MEALFTHHYGWLWALALAAALFYPVRQLIWVLYVRRAERDGVEDAERRAALKRRSSVTAALLCLVFAFFYTAHLFRGAS